jgi:hypothetical protein
MAPVPGENPALLSSYAFFRVGYPELQRLIPSRRMLR